MKYTLPMLAAMALPITSLAAHPTHEPDDELENSGQCTKLNDGNYRQIKLGMTIEQAEHIFGCYARETSATGNIATYSFSNGPNPSFFFYVTKGKITSKNDFRF